MKIVFLSNHYNHHQSVISEGFEKSNEQYKVLH